MLSGIAALVGSLAFGAWVKSGAASAWMFLALVSIGLLAAAIAAFCVDRRRFY